MNGFHVIGILIAVFAIIGISIIPLIIKKNEKKYNGSVIVAGVIMGTMVGGSSTVGTAQLAYHYGMSAWWFTIGSGLGCLILTLVFLKPIKSSGSNTLVGIVAKEYGKKIGMTAAILNSIGTLINIISQILAASAVLLVILPVLNIKGTVLISAIFMIIYIIFGGTKGAGMAGIVKVVLLYLSMVVCGIVALKLAGGPLLFIDMVREMKTENGVNYFNPFARGVGTDLGSCLSLILGILTTQIYAQGLLSGKNEMVSKRGGLISAILIPPIGIAGIIVGLYMRFVTDPTCFSSKTALTQFVLEYLPPFPGGIVLGALFVASIGTGAGLALGIVTDLCNDIIKKKIKRFNNTSKMGLLYRGLIVGVLFLAASLSMGSTGDTILNFSFMSMALRGAVMFIPLCFAIWMKGRLEPAFVLLSMIVSPLFVLLFGTVFKGVLPFDSLIIGIISSAVIMCIGLWKSKWRWE